MKTLATLLLTLSLFCSYSQIQFPPEISCGDKTAKETTEQHDSLIFDCDLLMMQEGSILRVNSLVGTGIIVRGDTGPFYDVNPIIIFTDCNGEVPSTIELAEGIDIEYDCETLSVETFDWSNERDVWELDCTVFDLVGRRLHGPQTIKFKEMFYNRRPLRQFSNQVLLIRFTSGHTIKKLYRNE